jgi:glycosyltransferase involved in cell wall biosynthesis
MKVLMVSKACVAGAYQRKLEAIAALGVELTVVVPPRWEDERGSLMLERKHTSGYRLVESPLRFNGHFHLHYYPQLRRWLQSTRPDIVHVDEEPGDFVAFHTIRNAVHAGARPLFFSWQNLMRVYPPPFRWFAQYAFNRCSHALAGNADAERVLRAKGYRGIIRLIPQFGVDPEIFKPVVRPEAERNRPFTLAYAGRMTAVKGVDILLRAAAGIKRDWRLRLIGNGPERDNLRRLAHELDISDKACFEPQLASSEMPRVYGEVDLYVLPSRSAPNWTEQFGRVLIEAMACGVPVIGAATGEIPNTIGDAGLTFAENDAAGLQAQIERVMTDETLRRDLQERGLRRVLQNFTQASIAHQTVEVYREMLDAGPLPAPSTSAGHPSNARGIMRWAGSESPRQP